ncbi:carnosine N-methyltransferase isoform X2 [Episyrphus balteatus]|uniref:carnosine N-methyltransferase isoform X2 n=1 Tax=Episyrphus balteatus TaxID=286459 RepID=UPI0024866363|nr:carnosine N-methyltransferase isoform X2 [Episyrphus balteatus]
MNDRPPIYSPPLRPEDEEDERRHFLNIIQALKCYRSYSYARVDKTEYYLNTLNERHQNMLAKYRNHIGDVRYCIDENFKVIQKMLRDSDEVEKLFCQYPGPAVRQEDSQASQKVRYQDMENVQSTLKQFARDWSAEGEPERSQCYKPIIDAIESFFDPEKMELNEVKVLVPGAGLGRMAYELACRGYFCEGNEFSYFMLIASNFVLNQCTIENQFTLYPWVHQYVNNLRKCDQIAPIKFPDVCPLKSPPKGEIMITAGDFLQVYEIPNSYDCVATCFFIDCANNIVEFIETIYKILVPGGIWVNLGPLLYHFSDMQSENSIEPTHEDLMTIIDAVGFETIKSETGVRTKYAQNPRSMLKSEYESLFWVCRKPSICPKPPTETEQNGRPAEMTVE